MCTTNQKGTFSNENSLALQITTVHLHQFLEQTNVAVLQNAALPRHHRDVVVHLDLGGCRCQQTQQKTAATKKQLSLKLIGTS